MGHKTPTHPTAGSTWPRSALTGSAIRVGIPCFFMYIQGSLWGQHSNKPRHFATVRKRGYEKKWRREWEDTLQATVLASSMRSWQVSFHEISRLHLWVRSHLSESESPTLLAINTHSHLAPPPRQEPDRREYLGLPATAYQPLHYQCAFFPALTGPRASYSTGQGWHTSKSIPDQVYGPERLTD